MGSSRNFHCANKERMYSKGTNVLSYGSRSGESEDEVKGKTSLRKKLGRGADEQRRSLRESREKCELMFPTESTDRETPN